MKCKLSDVIEIIGGGTPKTTVAAYWNGKIPWLSVKDFNNDNRYVYITEKCITEEGLQNSSTTLLKKDDIIISARGTVGALAMVPYPMAFNQSCYGIKAKEGIVDKSYLYYTLKFNVEKLKKNTHGSVFDTITRDTFSYIEINLPELETQKGIAKILSSIDDKIELNNAINHNLLQQLALTFDQTYVTGRTGTLGELISVIESGSRPRGGAESHGIPSIGAENIEEFGTYDFSKDKYISEHYFSSLNRGIVESRDVLLYKDGAYTGKVSMSLDGFPHKKCAVNEHVFILRTFNSRLQFSLYCLMARDDVRNKVYTLASSKAAQPGLNQNELRSVPINIPSESELYKFEQYANPMMHLIAKNANENKLLANLRDSLLPRLMSGEIDVSEVKI